MGRVAFVPRAKRGKKDCVQNGVKVQRPLTDAYRVAEIKDAQIAAKRWDRQTARRFYAAFTYAESAFGSVDSPCPKIEERDEPAYLVALIAGTFAVLHDKQSDGTVGVPLDLLPKIARASTCLDNEKWWHVPQALQGGIWATIPGSGPDDVEPWSLLEQAAKEGAQSGVRVAYAVGALLANNAGDTDRMRQFLIGHGESVSQTPRNDGFAFFDQYAYEVSLHQSDLLWISAKGIVRQNWEICLSPSRKLPLHKKRTHLETISKIHRVKTHLENNKSLNSMTIAAHSLILRKNFDA